MKHLASTAFALFDGGVRIATIITLDTVNKALATIVALLTIAHLVIKIRKERS